MGFSLGGQKRRLPPECPQMNESIATENCGFEVGVYDLRAGSLTYPFPLRPTEPEVWTLIEEHLYATEHRCRRSS